MRTVLHYSARCENADTRSLINEEATAQGADELAKDLVSNEKNCLLLLFTLVRNFGLHIERLDNIDSNSMIYT